MNPALQKVLSARSFRWGVNTVASFVVNLGMTVGLHEWLSVDPSVAYAVALLTVFLMNFVFFRYYVFSHPEPLPIRSQFMAYAGSAVGFRLAEYLCFLLVHIVFGVHYVVTIIAVQGASFIAKYFFYGAFVFRGRHSAPRSEDHACRQVTVSGRGDAEEM